MVKTLRDIKLVAADLPLIGVDEDDPPAAESEGSWEGAPPAGTPLELLPPADLALSPFDFGD